MRKISISAAAFLMGTALCLTGCGSSGSSTAGSDTTAANTTAASSTETTFISAGGNSSAGVDERIPDMKANVSEDVNLAIVNINGVEVDISDITLAQFLEKTGLVKGSGNSSYTFKEFKYDGKLFTLPAVDGKKQNVSVAVEVVDENGEFVKVLSMKEQNYDKYKILGLHVSSFAVNDSFRPSFIGGITIGSTKDEVEKALGSPEMMIHNYAYSNGSQVMVVAFNDTADEIFILNKQ